MSSGGFIGMKLLGRLLVALVVLVFIVSMSEMNTSLLL